MRTALRLWLALLGLSGCNRLLHRHAPDASPVATASTDAASAGSSTTSDDAGQPDAEEEATSTDGGGACPRPIHPDYCRHACRDFAARADTKHAKRIGRAARVGFGTCGGYRVFAEDEQPGDAGVKSGLVEFFEGTDGGLVGAIDTRSKPCGQFGQIPACTPVVTWEGGYSVSVRMGAVTVSGHQLPAEVIERIVRQNFGRFKLCSMRPRHPTQEGRVVTKVVIAKDGTVSSSQDDGSDLADKEITACVVRAFSGLRFPEFEGAPLTVTFPVLFSR